jgi:hypothetical protein
MKLNQIGILSNIAEKQNYNPIFALLCPALSCRAGQDRAGHTKIDESFFEQSRAGQGQKMCPVGISDKYYEKVNI